MKHLFQTILDWYQHALQIDGVWVVGLLMTAESSVLPLPSESIIPVAASWSHAGKISVSLPAIVIAGAIGSWLGATIVYWISRLAGRPLLIKYGRYILITPDKIRKAENWSAHYGAAGVFVARLLPGARQLVGIPAGIAKFDYIKFSIFTIIGAAIWCSVLCWVGVTVGTEAIKGEMHKVVALVGGIAIILGALYYFFVHRHMAGRETSGMTKD